MSIQNLCPVHARCNGPSYRSVAEHSWLVVPSTSVPQNLWELATWVGRYLQTRPCGRLYRWRYTALNSKSISRDEDLWRSAAGSHGCRIEGYNSIRAASTSWQSFTLFLQCTGVIKKTASFVMLGHPSHHYHRFAWFASTSAKSVP